MKKVITVMGIGLIILGGITTESYGETGKGFYLGVGMGSFPVWIFNSYYVNGEIGFRFSKRVGIVADIGYAQTSVHHESESEYVYYNSSYTSTRTYRSVPVSGSLIISAPVGDNFLGYVGLGLGYYKTKMKEESTYQNGYTLYNGTNSHTDESETKAIAPHISFGIEFAVSKQIAIFGELKHIVGLTESEEKDEHHYSKDRSPLGGSVAKIGFRIYF